MKIYTRTGDAGETGLFAGPRVRKNNVRIQAYGDVDELNSVLGMVRAATPPVEIDEVLVRIQNELFSIGAELATPEPGAYGTQVICEEHVAALETLIDRFEDKLEPLKEFILPAGTAAAASLHFARAVCRRAERSVVTLADQDGNSVSESLLHYLNRLSDLLFVLSRSANAIAGSPDEVWQKPESNGKHSPMA
jgi:cob(I)alamin adenosyltransferase